MRAQPDCAQVPLLTAHTPASQPRESSHASPTARRAHCVSRTCSSAATALTSGVTRPFFGSRFGTPVEAQPGRLAVRLDAGYDLADVVRALDAESLKVAHLELDEPSLDDVFLAKTGHRLEGQADAQPERVGA